MAPENKTKKPLSTCCFSQSDLLAYLLNWVQVVYRQQQHLYCPKYHHTLCPRSPQNKTPLYQRFHSLKAYLQPVWYLCHCIQQSALKVEKSIKMIYLITNHLQKGGVTPKKRVHVSQFGCWMQVSKVFIFCCLTVNKVSILIKTWMGSFSFKPIMSC